jgi:hypothetical protein
VQVGLAHDLESAELPHLQEVLLHRASLLPSSQRDQRSRHVPQRRGVLQVWGVRQPVVGVLHCRRYLAEELGTREEKGIRFECLLPDLLNFLGENIGEKVCI